MLFKIMILPGQPLYHARILRTKILDSKLAACALSSFLLSRSRSPHLITDQPSPILLLVKSTSHHTYYSCNYIIISVRTCGVLCTLRVPYSIIEYFYQLPPATPSCRVMFSSLPFAGKKIINSSLIWYLL